MPPRRASRHTHDTLRSVVYLKYLIIVATIMAPVALTPHFAMASHSVDESQLATDVPTTLFASLEAPGCLATDTQTSDVWVCETSGQAVRGISSSGAEVARIPLTGQPADLKLDAAARLLYVLVRDDMTITVVNLDSRSPVGEIRLSPPLVGLNAQPQLMVADWPHSRIFIPGAADLVPGSSTMGVMVAIDTLNRSTNSVEPILLTPEASANVGIGPGAFDSTRQRVVSLYGRKDEMGVLFRTFGTMASYATLPVYRGSCVAVRASDGHVFVGTVDGLVLIAQADIDADGVGRGAGQAHHIYDVHTDPSVSPPTSSPAGCTIDQVEGRDLAVLTLSRYGVVLVFRPSTEEIVSRTVLAGRPTMAVLDTADGVLVSMPDLGLVQRLHV